MSSFLLPNCRQFIKKFLKFHAVQLCNATDSQGKELECEGRNRIRWRKEKWVGGDGALGRARF